MLDILLLDTLDLTELLLLGLLDLTDDFFGLRFRGEGERNLAFYRFSTAQPGNWETCRGGVAVKMNFEKLRWKKMEVKASVEKQIKMNERKRKARRQKDKEAP